MAWCLASASSSWQPIANRVAPDTRAALLWLSSAALAMLVGLVEVYVVAAVVSQRHPGLAVLLGGDHSPAQRPHRSPLGLRAQAHAACALCGYWHADQRKVAGHITHVVAEFEPHPPPAGTLFGFPATPPRTDGHLKC